jgi:hypothetical protein
VPFTGGRSATLLQSEPDLTANAALGDETWEACANQPTAWSPDSRLIAVSVTHSIVGEKGLERTHGILALSATAGPRAFFPDPDSRTEPVGDAVWSPRSTKIALAYFKFDYTKPKAEQRIASIVIHDLITGSSEVIATDAKSGLLIQPIRWTSGGRSVICSMTQPGLSPPPPSYVEISIEGKAVKPVQGENGSNRQSPNGLFKLANNPSGIYVENCTTGAVTEISKAPERLFLGWSPNSRMLAYSRVEKLSDETNLRQDATSSLWLAVPESNKLNHMCLAVSIGGACCAPPSWSKDSLRLVYVSDVYLFAAELEIRPATPREKVGAGLSLTDEEMKEMLLQNAQQIGTAISMRMQDYDGELPDGSNLTDGMMTDLCPYIAGNDVFFRPGTQQNIFRYLGQGNISGMQNPAGTAIGILDGGYGWQAIVYGDGHAGIVLK